jgi:glycosyltransferase involved in cell wall biosynthesis
MERVDVVIPVRDGAPYLAAAIESVLAQTQPAARIVVIDDGSQDESAAIAERFGAPVTVLRRPAAGAPFALNAGIAASDAPVVAFLDADDLWEPRKLELQLDLLARRPDVELVFGHMTEFLDGVVKGGEARASAIAGVGKSTLLVRRTTLDRVGVFDESYAVIDFPEWYSRAQAAGVVEHLIPDVVARRRVHGNNVSLRRKETANAEYLRMARAAVLRRRAS